MYHNLSDSSTLSKKKVLDYYLQIVRMRIAKVRFENQFKKIDIKDLGYEQFKKRLYLDFPLQDKYYHLFFKDHEEIIPILSENDYLFLKDIPQQSKLFLEKTDNGKLHFDGNISSVSTANQNNEELQSMAKEFRQSMTSKLQEFKTYLEEKMRKQLQKEFQKEKKKKMKANETIHYGIKCCNCKKGEIKGVRYECAICEDYNICEECEEMAYDHNPIHPFIKIKNQTQMLLQKSNTLKVQEQHKHKKGKQIEKGKAYSQETAKTDLINRIRQISSWSEAETAKFVNQNPNRTFEQLIEIYLAQNQ